MILQVAKLGPVSRAAGMDCEYPLYREVTCNYTGIVYNKTCSVILNKKFSILEMSKTH